MNIRIGIVTLYKNNFGSILQCYSTYSYIESLGFTPSIFEHPGDSAYHKVLTHLYRCFTQKNYIQKKWQTRCQIKHDLGLLASSTKKKMDEFILENFDICSFPNMHQLAGIANHFQKVVVGSDQIWNVSNGVDSFNFLAFTEERKRVTLAPSFGTNCIPKEFEKPLKKKLCGFSTLSAREQSGADIIMKLTGRPATRLPDPTILLSKEQWCDFSQKGIQKQNYVLVHFLNEPNEIAFAVINHYLAEYNADCICIVNNYESYGKLIRHEFLDIGPYDFVSLINNADFVFTDSFHSTLFSLNLETNFLTFDRQYSHANSQKTRVVELLDRCHELDRFIENLDTGISKLATGITWSSENLFGKEREKIRTYLQQELEKE